nr:MAG TPA_asm: hypothetical protein [Caudoviricetes sp.]
MVAFLLPFTPQRWGGAQPCAKPTRMAAHSPASGVENQTKGATNHGRRQSDRR